MHLYNTEHCTEPCCSRTDAGDSVGCAGKDTCEAFVTVMPVAPPTVTCKPFITLPAKASCAAQIATADLITAINGGTTPGNGGAVTPVIQPASPSGTYNLPVGTYDFTLAVTNCAGTGTCTSIVTVTDQEALQVQSKVLRVNYDSRTL